MIASPGLDKLTLSIVSLINAQAAQMHAAEVMGGYIKEQVKEKGEVDPERYSLAAPQRKHI